MHAGAQERDALTEFGIEYALKACQAFLRGFAVAPERS
jgi:hypothetical protein